MRLEVHEFCNVAGEVDSYGIVVVLSERNLLSLLTKLYTDGSLRTIKGGSACVPDGYALAVQVERDDEHYADESREGEPAGPMHPVTEALLAQIKGANASLDLEVGDE